MSQIFEILPQNKHHKRAKVQLSSTIVVNSKSTWRLTGSWAVETDLTAAFPLCSLGNPTQKCSPEIVETARPHFNQGCSYIYLLPLWIFSSFYGQEWMAEAQNNPGYFGSWSVEHDYISRPPSCMLPVGDKNLAYLAMLSFLLLACNARGAGQLKNE